jgi:hypothetical protein
MFLKIRVVFIKTDLLVLIKTNRAVDYDKKKQDKMSNYDNTTQRRFPTAFGGQRRGGGGSGGYNNRGGGGRRYQEVRYPAPEQKEVKKVVDVRSEMDFPSLGSDGSWATAKPSICSGMSSFATLAHKWKSDEEEEAARIQYEKEEAEKRKLAESRYILTSRFMGTQRYAHSNSKYDEEEEDDYDHYDELDRYEQQIKIRTEEEEWSTVERY